MPFWRIFYHVVWSTKNREPLIRQIWENDLHGYMWGKSTALGCLPHAINGVADHVHLAISIPPIQPISRIIGQIKGSSSRYINRELETTEVFAWQEGYGVISISERSLLRVIQYIDQQKIHHPASSTIESLERLV